MEVAEEDLRKLDQLLTGHFGAAALPRGDALFAAVEEFPKLGLRHLVRFPNCSQA